MLFVGSLLERLRPRVATVWWLNCHPFFHPNGNYVKSQKQLSFVEGFFIS